MVAAYRQWQTHSPVWLACSEGWQALGAQSAFIEWTGWTLALAVSWWQHYKHCLWYYYYYYLHYRCPASPGNTPLRTRLLYEMAFSCISPHFNLSLMLLVMARVRAVFQCAKSDNESIRHLLWQPEVALEAPSTPRTLTVFVPSVKSKKKLFFISCQSCGDAVHSQTLDWLF